MVKVNGMQEDVAGMTIAEFLERANYNVKRIVVERNEEIIPRTEYDQTVLQDGDTVEVITFMGGG